jgi:hypothetical protein
MDSANVPPQVAVGRNGLDWASIFSFSMNRTIRENATPGVSPHMLYHIVTRGSVQVRTGTRDMPAVAAEWEDLMERAEAIGASATGAIC